MYIYCKRSGGRIKSILASKAYAKAVYPAPALAADNSAACTLVVDGLSCPPESVELFISPSTCRKEKHRCNI